jgi:ribosomal protein S8
MINDVISDMLTRIRNANIVQHLTVQVLSTKLTKQIAEIL